MNSQIETIPGESTDMPTEQCTAKQLISEYSKCLRKRLTDCNIKRISIADKINCHPSFVTKVLNYPPNISVETMVKFANALDCDVEIKLLPR